MTTRETRRIASAQAPIILAEEKRRYKAEIAQHKAECARMKALGAKLPLAPIGPRTLREIRASLCYAATGDRA